MRYPRIPAYLYTAIMGKTLSQITFDFVEEPVASPLAVPVMDGEEKKEPVVSTTATVASKQKKINSSAGKRGRRSLKDIDATAEEITKELVETATNLRRMTIAAANTARASWKNYCLSFFCCASSPVQYNQLLFYILIERALNRAEQRNLIRGVNLERLSDPAIREQKLRRVLVI